MPHPLKKLFSDILVFTNEVVENFMRSVEFYGRQQGILGFDLRGSDGGQGVKKLSDPHFNFLTSDEKYSDPPSEKKWGVRGV